MEIEHYCILFHFILLLFFLGGEIAYGIIVLVFEFSLHLLTSIIFVQWMCMLELSLFM